MNSESKKRVTLYNNFHGTEVNVLVEFSDFGSAYLTKHQTRRVRKELCGCNGCGCKTVTGVLVNGVCDDAQEVIEDWDRIEQCEIYTIHRY